MEFDPSGVGQQNQLFGLPFDDQTGHIAILPVPWEITASAGSGSSKGPKAIFGQSPQIDLEISAVQDAWKCGAYMLPFDQDWQEHNDEWKRYTQPYIKWLESGQKGHLSMITENLLEGVNGICTRLNQYIKSEAMLAMNSGKTVGVLGGEHSCVLGLLDALNEKHGDDFAILQIDAHADLRDTYEGFVYSHASVMYNALKLDHVAHLVQVGIRDFSPEEALFIAQNPHKVTTYFDMALKKEQFQGKNWHDQCDSIIKKLPQKVFISFDIDGLNPHLCPNSGTPVPGGLSFEESDYLLQRIVQSGKEIIGFDLSEVVPGGGSMMNEIVGARVLYHLSVYTALSQGIIKFRETHHDVLP